MKTRCKLANTGLRLVAATALALALTYTTGAAEARTARGGAADLMQQKRIKTVADLDSVQPGDTVAMACPKCKTIYVTTVLKENRPGKSYELPLARHLCPGCDHITEVKGHGRMKTEKVVHVCRNCGSKSAFCCVMKEGEGPTKGMEEKK